MFEILSQIFSVIAPVLFCALIGYWWARSKTPYDSEFVSNMVLYVAAPCLIIATMSESSLSSQLFLKMALACVAVTVVMGVLGALIIKMLNHDIRVYLPSLMFPNVGNMGLPLCLLAFGEEGLALALSFFMVLSLAHFPVGIFLASGDAVGGGLQRMLKMPILYAIAFAIIMLVTGYRLPEFASNSVALVGAITIPLMLITLGVSLHSLRVSDWKLSVFYSSLRIFVGMAVGWSVATLMGFKGAELGVVMIQASMPVAVFNYLFAVKFNRSPEQVAGMVVVSTLMAFVTLPGLLYFIL